MSECLEKVFANNRFLVGFYEKKEPYGLFWMVVVHSNLDIMNLDIVDFTI